MCAHQWCASIPDVFLCKLTGFYRVSTVYSFRRNGFHAPAPDSNYANYIAIDINHELGAYG